MSIVKVSSKAQSKFNMSRFDSHSFYEIFFLEKGERFFVLENKKLKVLENSFLIIPPHVLHKTMGNNFYKRTNVYISTDLLTKRNEKFLRENGLICYHLEKDALNFIKTLLKNPLLQDKEEWANLAAVVNSLIFFISKQKLLQISNFDEISNNYNKIVNYIADNVNEDLSLKKLCKEFLVSKNVLYKWFRENFQCTVYDYVLLVRLNKVKNLLANTSLSLGEIASLSGFKTANYLSLIFKKKIGVSPTLYRKQY